MYNLQNTQNKLLLARANNTNNCLYRANRANKTKIAIFVGQSS